MLPLKLYFANKHRIKSSCLAFKKPIFTKNTIRKLVSTAKTKTLLDNPQQVEFRKSGRFLHSVNNFCLHTIAGIQLYNSDTGDTQKLTVFQRGARAFSRPEEFALRKIFSFLRCPISNDSYYKGLHIIYVWLNYFKCSM